MGNYIPTSAPTNRSQAYFAGEVDAALTTLFQMVTGITVDASGDTAGRSTYDAEAQGFWYYDSEAGFFYQKQSATSADWSDGVPVPTAALTDVVAKELLKRQVVQLKNGTGPIVIVAWGDSNTGGSNNDAAGDGASTHPNVFMYDWIGGTNPDGGTDTWVLSEPGFGPMNTGGATPNNLVHNLGIRIYEETGRDVYIILKYHGSTGVKQWTTSHTTYDRFLSLEGEITNAFLETEMTSISKTQVDLMVCLVGAADSDVNGYNEATFAAEWIEVYDRFRGASWFPRNTPSILCELPDEPDYGDRNDFLSDPHNYGLDYVTVAKASDLAVDSSGVHYTGASLRELGYNRAYDALMRLFAEMPVYERDSLDAPNDELGVLAKQALAVSEAGDILRYPENGGLAVGASAYTEFEGKMGSRGIHGPTLVNGGTVPIDMPGGTIYMNATATLAANSPGGYKIRLKAISAGAVLSPHAGGSIDGSASYTLASANDTVTVSRQNATSTLWVVESSHKN